MKIKLTQRKKQLRPDTNRHLRFYMQYPDNAFRDLMATSAAGGPRLIIGLVLCGAVGWARLARRDQRRDDQGYAGAYRRSAFRENWLRQFARHARRFVRSFSARG